jgi:hypothetical protein
MNYEDWAVYVNVEAENIELKRQLAELKGELALVKESQSAWKDLAQKYEEALKAGNSYRCYHCGNIFIGEFEARNHFGARDAGSPSACLLEDKQLLDWWHDHPSYEHEDDWDSGEIVFYRVTGNRSDREWHEVARGKDLRSALRAAIDAAKERK